MLQDNKFPWLARMSVDPSTDNVSSVEDYSAPTAESKAAQAMSMHLYFPCGIIRGALSNLGIPCAVSADISSLPACAYPSISSSSLSLSHTHTRSFFFKDSEEFLFIFSVFWMHNLHVTSLM